MEENTALVITDPQNDFLSPDGATWGMVGDSVTANNTVENIESLFKVAKEYDVPVFISPHYYYPTDHGWRFEGKYGGFCAFGVSVGAKFDGDPTLFRVVDGKLYFNLNPEIRDQWIKDIPGNIKKANRNWRTIRNKTVSELINDRFSWATALGLGK